MFKQIVKQAYQRLKTNSVAFDSSDKKQDSVYSKRIKAGKRRTYFFDVRATKGNDYFLTITESRKRFNDDGYDRHKIFLYKEDFNKFLKGLNESVDHVKTELMPNFDFDAFNHEDDYNENTGSGGLENESEPPAADSLAKSETQSVAEDALKQPISNGFTDDHVDKW